MKTTQTLILFVFLFFSFINTNTVYTQAGTLDATFGNNGISTINFQTGDFHMFKAIVQSDGKIVCFGHFFVSSASGFFPTLVRLNPAGTDIDFSFANNGVRVLGPQVSAFNLFYGLEKGSDGSIYAATRSGFEQITVYKLTQDGDLDLSYNSTGIVEINNTGNLSDIALQPDGKLVAAYTRNDDFGVTRLNTNGSLDMAFGTNGLQTHSVFGADAAYDLTVQDDGKIVVCGSTDDGFGNMLGIIRLNSNGSLDNSFGSGGKVFRIINGGDFAHSVKVKSDGKIVVAGRTAISGNNQKAIIAGFNANGTEDNSFGTSGLVEIQLVGNVDIFYDLLIQPDEKILVTGVHNANAASPSFLLTRLNSNGTPDINFGLSNDGIAIASLPGTELIGLSIALDPNGDAIIGGSGTDEDSILLAKFFTGLNLSGEEFDIAEEIQIYPNPARSIINISLKELFDENLSVEIYNSWGQLVMSEHHTELSGQQVTLNIANLKSGVYFGVLKNDSKVSGLNFRFVKI